MSESVCPKCGAGVRTTWHSDYNGTATDYLCGHTIYADGTKTQHGEDCLRRQLAQARARIAELVEIIEAMYDCGTRTGVDELYAEYQKEVMGDE